MCLDVDTNIRSGVCGSPLKTLEVFSITQDQVRPFKLRKHSISECTCKIDIGPPPLPTFGLAVVIVQYQALRSAMAYVFRGVGDARRSLWKCNNLPRFLRQAVHCPPIYLFTS